MGPGGANETCAVQGDGGAGACACLVLVCGLPGCGKTSLCRALLARASEDPALLGVPAEWHHICYDSLEAELRGASGEFDPSAWRATRERAKDAVRGELRAAAERGGRMVFLLDDNMYYRSMRKWWYHFAREQGCAYRQVFLAAGTEACLERNRCRAAAARVPEFSIHHMADVFEWPPGGGDSWEARGAVSTTLEASEAATAHQAESLLRQWAGPGAAADFWAPVPPEDPGGPRGAGEAQGAAHACDVALRRVVSRALANAPQEISHAKSTLAKQWAARKAAFVKQLSAELKAGPLHDVEDRIHEVENAFLKACVADIHQSLAA